MCNKLTHISRLYTTNTPLHSQHLYPHLQTEMKQNCQVSKHSLCSHLHTDLKLKVSSSFQNRQNLFAGFDYSQKTSPKCFQIWPNTIYERNWIFLRCHKINLAWTIMPSQQCRIGHYRRSLLVLPVRAIQAVAWRLSWQQHKAAWSPILIAALASQASFLALLRDGGWYRQEQQGPSNPKFQSALSRFFSSLVFSSLAFSSDQQQQ